MTEQGLLTVEEVASYLGMSPCTVYRQANKNEIPFIKLGSRLRFRRAEIDDWLAKRQRRPIVDPRITLNIPPAHAISSSGGISGMPTKGKAKSRLNFGIGAIYVRKSKSGSQRYYLDYSDNGKRIQRVCKKAASFEDAYSELRRTVLREHDKKRATFSAFADDYLEDYAKPTKKS